MSDMKELNTAELESTAGGKNDSDPFRVIGYNHGGRIGVYSTPNPDMPEDTKVCYLYEGDHYIVTGDTVTEMTPIRVLKNNKCGYIHYSFVYGY